MKLLTEEQTQEINNKMEKEGIPRRIKGVKYVNGEPFYLIEDLGERPMVTLEEPIEYAKR